MDGSRYTHFGYQRGEREMGLPQPGALQFEFLAQQIEEVLHGEVASGFQRHDGD